MTDTTQVLSVVSGVPSPTEVRVRFCPSPTGNPHVGMVRTALFNWAFARHTGGTFVFRIEDTDASRDSEQSYEDLLGAMRWLGLDWDEGPEVGGECGPYRQSERRHLYVDVADRLLAEGYAYRCYCSPEEVEARYEVRKEAAKAEAVEAKNAAKEAGATGKQANEAFQARWAEVAPQPGYDGHCRDLDQESAAEFVADGRRPVLRFRMPEGAITWTDLIRGEMSFDSAHVPDYVLVRANGDPLYPLVNPVDDALMRISHVLRGEDLLSSTPRQIALYRALIAMGMAEAVPRFGHLPYVMGEGNKKLSKRDAESHLNMYREKGFLPEGLLNYLALLGWSLPRGWPLPENPPPGTNPDTPAEGRERDVFSLDEMVAAFELTKVNPNPARFDLKKCTAINGDHIRWLPEPELGRRLLPYLREAGLISTPITDAQQELLDSVLPLVHERLATLGEISDLIGFLFVDEADFTVDEDEAARQLGEQGRAVIGAAVSALDPIPDVNWVTFDIEEALREALIDGMGLKPRLAFGPVRLAITGKRISPPLFESMELLGRERCLSRLRAAM